MKLSEFKNSIKLRTDILKINIINSFQIETAYFSQGWGNILSTVFWTLSYLVFLHVIFSNVKSFAGYTKDEILLLTLVGQISFYFVWMITMDNIQNLIDSVNTGQLDLILTRPLPSLLYVSFKQINLVSMLRDGIPSVSILVLAINWSNLTFDPINLLSGLIIFVLGQICINCFMFLSVLPAFWYGQSGQTFWVTFDIYDSLNNIPYEGFNFKLKTIFTTLIPVLIANAVTTSVLLGKSNNVTMLIIAALISLIMILIKLNTWKLALRHYSSASS